MMLFVEVRKYANGRRFNYIPVILGEKGRCKITVPFGLKERCCFHYTIDFELVR